jgi:2-polyprenyl-6-methoxyphenol hydroxylase-like FAD-dependent oxidoreductase
MQNRNILISGAGIAGPALAWWLHRHGFNPTVVEQAPEPRNSGYMIDFWGTGYEVAERMGLRDTLEQAGYHFEEMRIVDSDGRKVSGFDALVFAAATDSRFVSIPRGNLARILYNAARDDCEFIFGDSIASLQQQSDGVDVAFRTGTGRTFDLVIGADGLHSNVRSLAFDRNEIEFKFLGYHIATFEGSHYPHRDENVFVSYNVPGRNVARYALRDGTSAFLFIFASDAVLSLPESAAQRAYLHKLYDGAGWECAEIMAALDHADSLYFDSVSQVRMHRWSNGRVALVGDAAYCPSVMAGQGSALAMTGAFVLAQYLAEAGGDYNIAYRRYYDLLHNFILKKQRAAEKTGSFFAPRTAWGIQLRNYAINNMRIPGMMQLVAKRSFGDRLELPG